MIITCPHCQTKYQVTYEAIGATGRQVQCAHCQEAWQQAPLPPEKPATPAQKKAAEVIDEDKLDEAFAAEQAALAAEREKKGKKAEQAKREAADAGKIDPAVIRNRQRAFSQRQHTIFAGLPLARLRRVVRIGALLTLAGMASGFYFGRVSVVQTFPATAGLYAAVGLGVNVVGLDFSNVTTLRTLRDGKEVLIVSAQIFGLSPAPVPVPPVVVTLIGPKGEGVYEWSVNPAVRDLMAGERTTFDTQLTLPPGDASRVHLSFAGGASLLDKLPGMPATPATEEHDQAQATEGHEDSAATQEAHEPASADAHGDAAAPAETHTPEHH